MRYCVHEEIDIWWIRYTIDGRKRREKMGRRGDALKLY
jgi:hypothetical protein